MYNIRLGLFETNSSSTHTIVIMKKEDFQRWRKSSDEKPNDETLYFIKHTDGNKSSVTFITEKQVKDDLFANISWIKDKYMKALEDEAQRLNQKKLSRAEIEGMVTLLFPILPKKAPVQVY